MQMINVPVLTLFANPDIHSEPITQALYGAKIKVLKSNETLSYVQMIDGYEGWCDSKSLVDESMHLKNQPLVRIIHNAVHLYAVPHVNKAVPLLTLPFEVELSVLSEPSDDNCRWIEVALVSGKNGWIQRGNVQLNPVILTSKAVALLSHQFLGLPYTWGGTSSFGYDCSGFTQMLYRQMGIALPRDARQQVMCPQFESIAMNELKEGDLLFFGESLEKITHVAFSLGSGHIIHSSVKPIPCVQITALDDSNLLSRYRYMTARRVKQFRG